MAEKVDRRVRKTKAQLRAGLARLMQKKSIKEITVKELVDEVDINRSTFYLHYSDIPTLLREIENLYDKLKQNKNGTYIGSRKIGEPGFCYKLYADELLKKVRKLYFSFHPDYLDESDIADFMHTIDKEVCYVDSLYQEVIKPNATKKRKLN